MNQETGKLFNILRFPLICGVLFIHIYLLFPGDACSSAPGHAAWRRFLENATSQYASRCCVPLFFLMSGYLFFGGRRVELCEWLGKLRRRIRSIVFPYLTWNLVGIAVLVMPYLLHRWTGIGTMSPDNVFARTTWTSMPGMLAGFFGLTQQYPVNYPLWFLRDLFLLCLAAPLLDLLLARAGIVWIALLAPVWYFGVGLPLHTETEALFFFSAGAWLSLNDPDLTIVDRLGRGFLAVWPFTLVIASLPVDADEGARIRRICIICGVFGILWLGKRILHHRRLSDVLTRLGGFTIMVYGAHALILLPMVKLLPLLGPLSDVQATLIYFTMLPVLWVVSRLLRTFD